jgi:uncharacterized Ntn-hydrolase superfamily protein
MTSLKAILGGCILLAHTVAGATFSILAFDPETKEIGSAGATCIDNFDLADHLSYIVPGMGGANFQCSVARYALASAGGNISAGKTSTQVLQASSPTNYSQRMVLTVRNGVVDYAATTGASCGVYKEHLFGDNYIVAGNILKDASVLAAMQDGFTKTTGDLTDKLMAALLAAGKITGADSRCSKTSSASSYLRVAKATDPLNQPSIEFKQNTLANGDPVLGIHSQYIAYKDPNAARICYIGNGRATLPYNLNGIYMKGALEKMSNPRNFGPAGRLPLAAIAIPVHSTITASALDALKCEVLFLGLDEASAADPLKTPISSSEINEIRNWTLQPKRRTVIASGSYGRHWGYGLNPDNRNPNVPESRSAGHPIVSGPFGTLSSVNQGGSVQGTFATTLGASASMLKASNAKGTPSIVIDASTNAVLLSDIDLITSLGGLSTGPNITTQNDVLFANIVAFAITQAKSK